MVPQSHIMTQKAFEKEADLAGSNTDYARFDNDQEFWMKELELLGKEEIYNHTYALVN